MAHTGNPETATRTFSPPISSSTGTTAGLRLAIEGLSLKPLPPEVLQPHMLTAPDPPVQTAKASPTVRPGKGAARMR